MRAVYADGVRDCCDSDNAIPAIADLSVDERNCIVPFASVR